MKKISTFAIVVLLLFLSGCTNVNKHFQVDLPRVENSDFEFEQGTDTPYVELRDLYKTSYDEVTDRYNESTPYKEGILLLNDLSEDTYFSENNLGEVFFEDLYIVTSNDLPKYDKAVYLTSRARNMNISTNFHGLFVNLVLQFDDMVEGEIYNSEDEYRIIEGYYLANDESLHMKYDTVSNTVDQHSYAELLLTKENDKDVEHFMYFTRNETSFSTYESTYIEDKYSFSEYFTDYENGEKRYMYWYYDYEVNELSYLSIVIKDEMVTTFLTKYYKEENVLFEYTTDGLNETKSYSYLVDGEPMVEFSLEKESNVESFSITHNMRNVSNYDFMGGVTYNSDYEYLVKDNEVIDLGDYDLTNPIAGVYVLQRDSDSSSDLITEMYDLGDLEIINEYDFNIEETIDLFSKIELTVSGNLVTINDTIFDITSRTFLERIVGNQFKSDLDVIFD